RRTDHAAGRAAAVDPDRPARPVQSLADPAQGYGAGFGNRADRHHPAGLCRRPRDAGSLPLLRAGNADLSRARHTVLVRHRRERASGGPPGSEPLSAAGSVDIERPPALPRPWTKARVAGYAVLALWVLAGAGMVWFLVGSWNPEFFVKYVPWYGEGLLRTVILVVVSIVLGAAISVPVAYARMTDNRFLSALAYGYVYFFRGTPLLAQAFLVYYGSGAFRPQLEAVGLWWFFREAWYCAI